MKTPSPDRSIESATTGFDDCGLPFMSDVGPHGGAQACARAAVARWPTRLVIALLVCCASRMAGAAGVSTTVVPLSGQDPALEVLVWSPCKLPPSAMRMGPFDVRASKGCAVAGRSLPLVVISHGQGGTRLSHHDTATALAAAGFVVASFNHPGDSYGDDALTDKLTIFESRPAQVSRVISHMIEHWKDRDSINTQAIGVFGFSRGGYTALALAGAAPSGAAAASRFCGLWRSLVIPMCRQFGGSNTTLKAQADVRVKAVVVADPLNLFDASSFTAFKVPVQLWASEFGGAGVELAHTRQIRAWLPQAPDIVVAKGAGHFAFLTPCPEALRKEARAICEDAKGFDRTQWHTTMNVAVAEFFMKSFRSGQK